MARGIMQPMRRLVIACTLLLATLPALAWNGAGHRLSALIAWQTMPEASRRWVSDTLRQHPDHADWLARSGTGEPRLVFAEASTWADRIRHDPRFQDEQHVRPQDSDPALFDSSRHNSWHYVDFQRDGRRGKGQLDRAALDLVERLRSTDDPAEKAWALAWLIHLVGDLHQPLHVGWADDAGGNGIVVEDLSKGKPAFTKLHTWWDQLPGPADQRGKRLQRRAGQLLATHDQPAAGGIEDWRDESHALIEQAYPPRMGSVSLVIDHAFAQHARQIADQRVHAAGVRLGRLLDDIRRSRVSRGTSR